MADFSLGTLVLAPPQMILHPDTVAHTTQSCGGYLHGTCKIWTVNMETTANVDGVTFRLQGQSHSGAYPHWIDIQSVVSSTGASAAAGGINASEPIGETVIATDADYSANSTTGMEAYVHNMGGTPASTTIALAGDEATSEFVTVNTSIATDVTITSPGLVAEVNNDNEIVPYAEFFSFDVPNLGAGYAAVRLLVEHRGATGSNIHYMAIMDVATAIA